MADPVWFYVVQLDPAGSPKRLKFGTAVDPFARLKAFRTSAPKAMLRALWECERWGESDAIRAARSSACHPLSSEVFDVDSVESTLARLSEHFRRPSAPLVPVKARKTGKRGRPATGRTGVWHSIYLAPAYWEFIDQWDGDTPSQKIRNALDDLERFRPHGPAAKPRAAGGRFKKHPPTLLERATKTSLAGE